MCFSKKKLKKVFMRFRKLKNKDEDGVVENNEGLPQALLGSCNDCARQLQASSSGLSPCLKVLSLSHFTFYHSDYLFFVCRKKGMNYCV